MNIKDVAERAFKNAVRLGKIGNRTGSQKLRDVYSEYIEAMGAFKDNHFSKMDRFEIAIENGMDYSDFFKSLIHNTYEDELTDMLFVILTLMNDCGMDIEKHIEAKMKYNELRGDRK